MAAVSTIAIPPPSSISEPQRAGPPSAGSHLVLGGGRAGPDDDHRAPSAGLGRRIGMRKSETVEENIGRTGGGDLRRRLLAGAPITERRLDLAGVSTAVLESGHGPPVVLLHGQGGWAGVWVPVMADLARDHRVVAPDLPGLGASRVAGAPPGAPPP